MCHFVSFWGHRSRKWPKFRSGNGLTLETPAFKLFTVANLRYQLSWEYWVTLLYFPTDAAPQFLEKLTHFIHFLTFTHLTANEAWNRSHIVLISTDFSVHGLGIQRVTQWFKNWL